MAGGARGKHGAQSERGRAAGGCWRSEAATATVGGGPRSFEFGWRHGGKAQRVLQSWFACAQRPGTSEQQGPWVLARPTGAAVSRTVARCEACCVVVNSRRTSAPFSPPAHQILGSHAVKLGRTVKALLVVRIGEVTAREHPLSGSTVQRPARPACHGNCSAAPWAVATDMSSSAGSSAAGSSSSSSSCCS